MSILDAIRNHPAISAGIGGASIGTGAVAIAGIRRASSKKKTTKKKTRSKRRDTKSKRKTTTAAKRRRAKALRSANPKKIYKTKNGQPYIKLKSGKCRFIKKRTASNMRKRKGGFR